MGFFIENRSGEKAEISYLRISSLELLRSNESLIDRGRYRVDCNVSKNVLIDFANHVNGTGEATVTGSNYKGLKDLCSEMGYHGLDAAFEAYSSRNCGMDCEALEFKIAQLEQKIHNQDRQIEHYKQMIRDMQDRISFATDPSFLAKIEFLETYARTGVRPIQPGGSVPPCKLPPLARTQYSFPWTGNNWGGIIRYLTEQAGNRNIASEGLVEVTDCDNTEDKYWRASNVLDFESDYPFQSKQNPMSWFCIDFKDRRVSIESYSLRSWIREFMLSWRVEVSMTGEENDWTTIDERVDDHNIDGHMRDACFATSNPNIEARFVKVTMTKMNSCRHNYMYCTAFEIFGRMRE